MSKAVRVNTITKFSRAYFLFASTACSGFFIQRVPFWVIHFSFIRKKLSFE